METITTESLFSKLQKEKTTGELTPLPREFYFYVGTLLKNLSKGENTEDKEKQSENAKKMLMSLKERRTQKLLMYVAYDKQLPQPIPEEEEALYNEIRQILNKNTGSVKITRLKVVAAIPEVLTSDGRKIGPYKEGEIIEIANSGDAEFIVKNRIAEHITQ